MNDVFLFSNGKSCIVNEKGDEKKNVKHWAVLYGEYLESQKIDPLKCKLTLPLGKARFIRDKAGKLEITFAREEE